MFVNNKIIKVKKIFHSLLLYSKHMDEKLNFYFSRFCKIWLKFIIELQVFHSLLSRIKAIQCWRREREKRRQGGKIREAAFRYQQRHRWGVGNRKAGGWKRLRPVVSPRTAATLPRSLSGETVPLSLRISADLRLIFPRDSPLSTPPSSCARPNLLTSNPSETG